MDIRDLVEQYKNELLKAMNNNDKEEQGVIKTKVAELSQTIDSVKEGISEFYEDNFQTETLLSKGVSQQQLSFGTQLYCDNPDLKIVYAVKEDILKGQLDYFGELVSEKALYGILKDFSGEAVLVSVLDGNKDMFLRNNMKAAEYINFLNETFAVAQEAAANKSPIKIDLGRITYKIDTLFGYNDGTASKEQDELVMMFCHDSEVLRDGSTFRRHLYEHPNIKDLNYGGFDWNTLEEVRPLGPGDSEHWYEEIDEHDKLFMVDAIINSDSPFFNIKLLRTLVKEYYTSKIENAWWKGMGFDEGKLGIMRLKQNELMKDRFEQEKAKASSDGRKDFTFDGRVYPTGADLEKMKKEKEQAIKRAQEEAAGGGGAPQTGATPTNPNQ